MGFDIEFEQKKTGDTLLKTQTEKEKLPPLIGLPVFFQVIL
jgi:hypothetical protein